MAARRTHNSTANLDPYRVPWFADCAPSLLTNRTIRRYLDAYSEHKWPEVIKLTLIYGVLGLEQQFPGGSPSIAQLRALVEKGGAQLVVERNLPGLQRQILNLQTGLDAVFDRLAVEAPPPPALAAAGTEQGARVGLQQQPRRAAVQQPVVEVAARVLSAGPRPASALNPGPVAPKAPDTWRRGEPTGFPSPPRAADHPLRRSLDNQGATNPIYPDWWLAAGPPEPAAPKQVPRKQPRKQPRLAYSIQQQHAEASAAADDLVTAEYLMLPGSGYGQQQPEPVVAGEGPPVTLTTLTAEGSTTRTLGDAAAARQPPAAGRPGAAGSRPGVATAAARRPQAVPSKIREAVAASRRRAASQQQHRQQLLASAVAAGSSLFGAGAAGSSREQPQARHGPGSAAAEAVAACAPAAAADHFLSNPWTSCFLQPSAGGQAVGAAGFTQLPAADISPDDEARLAALHEDKGPGGEEGHVPGAPAAYAVLQEVVAEQAAAAAAAALGGEAGQEHWGQLEAKAAAAEAWLQQEEEQQQLQHGGAIAPSSSCSSRPKGSPDAVGSSRPRGVFADITSGLNTRTQQGPGSSMAAAAQPGAPWLDVCAEAQEGRGAGAASSQQGVGGSSVHGAADDWRTLPLIDDEADLQQQGLGQQQQPAPAQRHRAWACDYGHLEGVAPPPAKAPARQRRASGKPHKRWSETWVGDFGHLQEFPRFPRDAAFEHQGQPGSETAEGQPRPPASSKLLMSPADLQALVAAAGRLADAQQAAALTHTHTAAAEGPVGANSTGDAAAGADEADSPPSGPAPVDALGTHSLAARFAELLSRWDAQASAADLPAGVAARASVSYARHAVQPAAAEPAAAAGAAAAAAVGHTPSSPEQPAAAGSDHGSGSVDLSTSYASAEQSDDASAPAAGDASGLLSESQHAASELSAAGGEGTGADSASEAATSAVPPQPEAVAALLSAGFEASQEGQQMLAQALDRHDAIMQLIASLGVAPGSDEGLLASATPSGSELTL